uniref:bifunctional peptidase and arginyl-hydroxylase JMJD5 n=1 Tax=Panthera onca TaxID=9690 RepID=UPI002955399B|nr:bifunctional peptidase and arginyl-hydroxylase JMJD5 [Panthera onca]XP_060504807.1 bifunctional peptidase and arginyl-hydroxylase JMJD5 [Panthera onca]
MAGAGTLREALRALLPPTKEELTLQLGETVERSVVRLLREAVELFCGGRGGECLQASEAILDYSWEKLNTGPWRDVHRDWRRVYAFGCLLKAVCLCEETGDAGAVAAALRVCDMGLLMGAAILGDILTKVAAVLQAHLPSGKRPAPGPAQEQPHEKVSGWDCRLPHLRCPDGPVFLEGRSPLFLGGEASRHENSVSVDSEGEPLGRISDNPPRPPCLHKQCPFRRDGGGHAVARESSSPEGRMGPRLPACSWSAPGSVTPFLAALLSAPPRLGHVLHPAISRSCDCWVPLPGSRHVAFPVFSA